MQLAQGQSCESRAAAVPAGQPDLERAEFLPRPRPMAPISEQGAAVKIRPGWLRWLPPVRLLPIAYVEVSG
jgi:hypothetical protein